MDENNAISVVENLIETSKDGEKGYRDAAEHVKRSDLKGYFLEQSTERGRFANELQSELAKLGKPEKKVSGSASGAMGTVTVISTISSPRTPSLVADGTPFSRSRSFCPDCVPGGIFNSARPSIVGTSIFAPSAASVALTGTVREISSASRWKIG